MAEPSTSWIKQNLVLLAGIALPLLIIAIFGVAAIVPALRVPPPRHAFVFTDYHYYNDNSEYQRAKVSMNDGKVIFTLLKETDRNRGGNLPKFYIYEPEADQVREVTYSLNDADENGNVPLKELENIKLVEGKVAPDGYEFQDYSNRYRGGFFMREMFGSGYNSQCTLVKDGKVVRLRKPKSDQYFYSNSCYSTKPLGWIVKQ